ncbi:MAG: tRNA (guanosine(37)-N1)-methyltransferase TrmD [Nitrospinae bacterium]|nr:tRNA (guanosine(37)-N1)-methyltransferase TrmD [Nitrospinota bacterium]
MECNIITLFPQIFVSPLGESILKRAKEKGLLKVNIHNLRDFAEDKHRMTDDYPYGGGAGMVMKPEPIVRALEEIHKEGIRSKIILMSPQGMRFTQDRAMELAREERITFICGRYEGIDERISLYFIDDEISIGDYVLTGGELPAMVVIDAIVRLIPGVVGDQESVREDSFFSSILDYPNYTRPPSFRGYKVPQVLLSGDHEKIRIWRRKEALRKTLKKRPDLLKDAGLSEEDMCLLKEI